MKQSKKWMLVALALLALVALPLVGCKNDSVSEPVRYTVTFNTDGGSTVQSQTIVSGQKVPEPAEPTKNSYVFVGWYRDEQLTNKYDFTTPVTSSFTLYAKWGTEITSGTVASVIAGLTEGGPHTLVATGEWTDLSTLAEALKKDESKKVNLDLSKVSDLTEIGPGVFFGCSSLTSITIPASVETIGDNAFHRCISLTTVTFGEGSELENIWPGAFSGCSSLTSITIPASVKRIGGDAFKDCENLAEVTFGVESKLETIDDGAFYECSSLTSITIPASVTTIGEYAFYKCSSLTSITIPASVTTIGEYAFYGCSKLTTVTMEATEPPELGENAFPSGVTSILVPKGFEAEYRNATDKGWDSYKDKIPEPTS